MFDVATVTKECGGEARLDKGSIWPKSGLVRPPLEHSNVSANALKAAQICFRRRAREYFAVFISLQGGETSHQTAESDAAADHCLTNLETHKLEACVCVCVQFVGLMGDKMRGVCL